MKFFKTKTFYLLLSIVLIIAMIIYSSTTSWGSRIFGAPVNAVLTPFQQFFSWADSSITNMIEDFAENEKLKNENMELRNQINAIKNDAKEIEDLKEQIADYKKALKLKDNNDKYDFVGGNIIAKESGNWFNTFTIDVGAKDGIAVDNCVVTGDGLVGRVSKVGFNSSVVLSLIDPYSKVGAINSRTKKMVICVRGDINLEEEGKCRLEFFDDDIEQGDLLETSGVSGIYPKGLMIGTISQIKRSGNEFDSYGIVEPSVDFGRLREVFVMTQKKK